MNPKLQFMTDTLIEFLSDQVHKHKRIPSLVMTFPIGEEPGAEPLENLIMDSVEHTSKSLHVSKDYVEQLLVTQIYERPLKFLSMWSDNKANLGAALVRDLTGHAVHSIRTLEKSEATHHALIRLATGECVDIAMRMHKDDLQVSVHELDDDGIHFFTTGAVNQDTD